MNYGGHLNEGIKITTSALDPFPFNNGRQEGVHAAEPSAMTLSRL
jgi:hypothetical protein